MNLFALLFYTLSIYHLNSQFVGEIVYQNYYQSKTKGITDSEMTTLFGERQELYIYNNYYKIVHFGLDTSFEMYRGNENKVYMYKQNSDTITWIDAISDTLSHVSEYHIDSIGEDILGYKCLKLVIKSDLGLNIYFYNTSIPLNPTNFKNHKFTNWDLYTSIAKSVPLKEIFDYNDFKITSTAVKIIRTDLNVDFFQVPQGILKKGL